MPREDTQFKEGQSGNPKGGVEKYKTFKWYYAKYGEEVFKKLKAMDLEEMTAKEVAVIKNILKAAEKGDLNALTAWMNREEGMPTQPTECLSGFAAIVAAVVAVAAIRDGFEHAHR